MTIEAGIGWDFGKKVSMTLDDTAMVEQHCSGQIVALVVLDAPGPEVRLWLT